jgi:segregation and condensation protein A
MATSHFLKLDRFEGPLDLLLHLIKVHEIDIFDIDVFLLTQQYLDYLRLVDFSDLTDASEFLEMAASLIEIKSRMLLPRPTVMTDDGKFIEEDPRDSLQQRLIEYERFRRAAEELSARPQVGVEIMLNHEWKRLEKVFEGVEAPLTGDGATLCILYEQILQELADRKEEPKVKMHRHVVNVDQVISELRHLLETVTFTLFQGFYQKFRTRYEMVINVMAILELAKRGDLRIYQQEMKGPLWLYRQDWDVSQLPLDGHVTQMTQPVAMPVLAVDGEVI